MNCKTVVVICAVLSAHLIEGFALLRGNRCLCKRFAQKFNVLAMEKLEVHPRSSTCDKIEYIAIFKNDPVPKCVSPDLLVLKVLLSGKNRQLSHIKVIRHQ
ncbi:C-X-C motif chemokine 10-like [Dendropsophus ebraccatus]|uniref:C-X-C motif chemokine 10-like n=1 Tax=Dendropsophus ebraccatus TaxID=150705 RepID=UPI003831CE9C